MKNKKLVRTIIFIALIYIFINSNMLSNIKKYVGNTNIDVTTTTKTTKQTVNVTYSGTLKVYFIDVGQADSILIQNDGHNMLIDAGNNGDGQKLVNYFNSLGINDFDYVVGTHPHEDHIGGMDDIINNFNIDKYFMPDMLSTSKTFEDVLDALANKNMKYIVPTIGKTYTLGNAMFDIIYVDSNASNENDSSIVLKLKYNNNSFLFTGDASVSVEKKILDSDIKADVLKVGHHGSQYSSGASFLKKVNPTYAVIEVGTNNIYNHPKDIIINRLQELGAKIYRTDKDGTIIFESDGNKINISKEVTDTNGG